MKHPVDTSKWGEFMVGELFDCDTTKTFYPNKSELPPGDTPYITRSTYDNGISGYYDDINNEFTIEGNCLTIGAEGGIAFWQPKPFIAGVKVYTLRHPQLNELTALFVASLLNANSANYNYTNARVLAKIKAESIPLPLKPSADPSNYDQTDIDWTYMETVMSRVTARAKDRLANLPQPTDKKKTPVDTSAWGEFVAKDLFGPSQLGKYHNPKNLQESENGYPYICASNLNNGINSSMPYVTGDDLKPTPANIISWGKQCPYFTYHDTPCITSQGMYYINVADYSKLQIDFIITILTALTREYNYTNCLIGKIFDELVLKLPLKPSADLSNYTQEDIDWNYMENFMKTIETKAHDRLKSLQKAIA